MVRRLERNELNNAIPLIWNVFCEYEAVNYPKSGEQAFWNAIHSEEYLDMLMTEEEICKRFKRNGCYNGHIDILAQLNAVDACVIEKILHKNGLYDNRRTLRNKR